jgi:UDP-glucose 4,6-dehydratase
MRPIHKVLIVGAGWLGNKYLEYFRAQSGFKTALWRTDITDRQEVELTLDLLKPNIVINTAGKTGRPNIDWCETHHTETLRSNVVGPAILASCCAARNILLAHLSSGCIFDGASPNPNGFTEEDKPCPVSFYGDTKVAGDEIVSQFEKTLILRIRMPIDRYPNQRNLITKLAGYPKVIDALNSVTVVDDLLFATLKLIMARKTGIYNIVNETPVRHKDIMDNYRRLVDPEHRFELISLDELYSQKLATSKRSNCILDTSKLRKAGITLPIALPRICVCLEDYKRHL